MDLPFILVFTLFEPDIGLRVRVVHVTDLWDETARTEADDMRRELNGDLRVL
ncbi:hypothetical protein JVT61DRAFT_10620 [Boletus reticuloceps]|uniref:Uncharacterized protein n=1 Tax=Boletus reticuloceps TaxID=495285 RepID=A0A8I2YFN9_9AGAM|nr:hypothetical protein JVT61DRAFT_10620 [Boletus reticuloceps]